MIGSCLVQYGYSFKLENNGYSVYMNNAFNGHALDKNGLLNLDRSNTHIYNIDAKRCKIIMISTTYLWHCREGHPRVKRVKKVHADGSFDSLNFESVETCEPCLLGKMTKTPFSCMMERASGLLELVHMDVRSPMSVETHSGYRYFLAFTDDLSEYGDIYLTEHNSEKFERFKQFQSEVEDHHNKKIKCLR